MKYHRTNAIHLTIPQAALFEIFDECDGFDEDETGGRVIGVFEEHHGKLNIRVTGVIEAGPSARRSAVSFFQDGEYQERVFRSIEDRHPEVEHLGNWHTHHVNGLDRLSDGDLATYTRTVNHPKHHAPFFYALLVTARHRSKDPLHRYAVKHYVFRRGDEQIYELDRKQIEIVDAPLVWPARTNKSSSRIPGVSPHRGSPTDADRSYDNAFMKEFYRGIRAFSNAKLGMYWRGPIELLDGSQVEVVLLQEADAGTPAFFATLRNPPVAVRAFAEELVNVPFASARAALIMTERGCNRAIYHQHRIDVSV